jgi:glycosyltransferase involved in cell wall biosynthesis
MELAGETTENDRAGRGEAAALGCWHIITGEYPPQPGGVADYSQILAAGLAGAGAEVHVWAPPAEGTTRNAGGITVHRCAGQWSPVDLARLSEALDAFAPPRHLLVQYAPNAWGYRGMNLGFCRWLVRRRARGDDVRPMIHEPFYPFWLRDKPSRWLLAACHRWMFRTLLAASSHVYVAIPYWKKHLRAYEPKGRRPVTWLPVPSNIPVVINAAEVAELRHRLAPQGERILATFGTFARPIRRTLAEVLVPLLKDHPGRMGLLLGQNGEGFAAELQAAHPELAGRLIAPGRLATAQVSLYLHACDVLVQPYPEGVNTRRGSVMAGLAHGVATVTTLGIGTEPIWSQTGCVVLAAAGEPGAMIQATECLLADPAARARVGAAARETYSRHFDVQRSVEKILNTI